MTRIHRTKAAWCWLLSGVLCVLGGRALAQEENEALIKMVVELVGDADRDMRALGLQQIREEVPGEAATKRFAELVPTLEPEGQAALLEALGDRGDAAARPVVLDMLKAEQEPVRAAALRALGPLGTIEDVAVVMGKAADGSTLEKEAARQALVRLRGDEVNEAIVAAMSKGKPGAKVELLGVLAARNAREALPTVMESVADADASVRLAALGALRYLADESNTAGIVGLVQGAKDDAERRKAELALLMVCTRGGESCAEPIVAGLGDANVPSRIALVHALARSGGPKALEAVVARLKDDGAVADEAVRVLSVWRDPAVKPHLLAIAKESKSERHQVLAIRGLVRLARAQEEKPADLAGLTEAMGLAKRPDEKRLVLGALGGVASPESLALATDALGDRAVAEEACFATVMIAEKMEGGKKDDVRAAMQKVLRYAKNGDLRARAEKVLASP